MHRPATLAARHTLGTRPSTSMSPHLPMPPPFLSAITPTTCPLHLSLYAVRTYSPFPPLLDKETHCSLYSTVHSGTERGAIVARRHAMLAPAAAAFCAQSKPAPSCFASPLRRLPLPCLPTLLLLSL
jgi:hypothetical protein